MALAWKASWVKALRGSNPLSSAQRKTPACRGFFLCTGSRDLRKRGEASMESPILRHKKRTSFWVFFSVFNELPIAGEHLANKVISARALDSFQNKVIKNRKIWSDQDSQKMACRVHRNCDFGLCCCWFRHHGY